MLKLVIADDEGKKTVVPLVRDEITIGRKEGNTIRLTERNVSRRHARIVKRTNDYMLEDLASYNGIVVNNTRLVEARPIRHGDEIRIGDYTLQIVDEPGVQPAPSTPAPAPPSEPIVPLLSAPAAAPTASPLSSHNDPLALASAPTGAASQPVPEHIRGLRLVFLAPAGVPPPVMLDKLPVVMGRSEAADVALPFSSISREHAKVFLEDDKLMIEDMGSSNGVQVNGEKVKKGQLGPGDMVQLGVVEFRVARRGDSTVVIQKAAADEKQRAARRPAVGLIGAIVGGGLALGLAVVLVVNRMNPNPAQGSPTTTANAQTAPTQPTPEAQPATPTPVAPQPEAQQPQAAQPEPQPAQPETQPAQPEPQPAQPQAAQPEPQPAQPETQPPQPEAQPETQPAAAVVQHVESERERRARERRERELAARAAAPAPTPAPRAAATAAPAAAPTRPAAPAAAPTRPAAPEPASQPEANDGLSPMQRAQACRTSTNNEPDRNNCIINALRGRASSMQELGMLGATQMTAGRTAEATRTMRTYIQRYPQGPMVPGFQRYLDSHQ